MIALVDCQSFYCSCETAFRPKLRGKPVIVLSNNDHWIIALNREAKATGLRRGIRFKEAQSVIKENNITFFSSNYTLYNDISWRVMETLRDLSQKVEAYSIDEAFIDLSGIKNLEEYGRNILRIIKKQTLIPTTVGIAPTRSLAKVAQRLAKKTVGSLVLDTKTSIQEALTATPVSEIWGVGRSYGERMEAEGIKTAADFIKIPEWKIKKEMTSVGWLLQRELKGIPMKDLKPEPDSRKGIISARQFGVPVKERSILGSAISYYAELAVEKLQKQKCTASIVAVTLEVSGTGRHGGLYTSAEIQPTDYLPDITAAAQSLLSKLYSPDTEYWRTTIFLSGIEPVRGKQISFFSENNIKKSTLTAKIDKINDRYGHHTIHPCTSNAGTGWKMRREYLSPCYTTRMEDFPVAHVRI